VSSEFNPDWTIAPVATLREWTEQNGPGMAVRHLARRATGRVSDSYAMSLIQDVVDRKPLTEEHAGMLERATGIPARAWLQLERGYRADLAAGRKDVTENDETA
jgi:plasmid maintenance system antidote protein VapI